MTHSEELQEIERMRKMLSYSQQKSEPLPQLILLPTLQITSTETKQQLLFSDVICDLN